MKTINNAIENHSYRQRNQKTQNKKAIGPLSLGLSFREAQPQFDRKTSIPSQEQISLLEGAKDMDFTSLAHMLRTHLQSHSLKKLKVIPLLDLLDAKAGADKLLLRIARNLRQDWTNTGRSVSRNIAPFPVIKHLPWVLLPPGEGADQLKPLLAKLQEYGRRHPGMKIDQDRIRYAYKLRPSAIYIGTDHFDGYWAFLFPRTPKVLLENPTEGNAAYILSQNWKYLSSLSKSELMSRTDSLRVIHGSGWKRELKKALGL
jgi:hypothetical protein